MVVEDGDRQGGLAGAPAGIGLAVDHDDGRLGADRRRLDGDEGDLQQVDHRLVLGPGDDAVDGQGDGLAGHLRGSTSASRPSMLARASGSGLTCETRTTVGGRRQRRQEPVGSVPAGQDRLAAARNRHRQGLSRPADHRRHSSLRQPGSTPPASRPPRRLPQGRLELGRPAAEDPRRRARGAPSATTRRSPASSASADLRMRSRSAIPMIRLTPFSRTLLLCRRSNIAF